MRNTAFVIGILIFVLHLIFPGNFPDSTQKLSATEWVKQKKLTAISCTPDLNDPSLFYDDPSAMIPLPGWGNHWWNIPTRSDSALFYFNQGINMYYAFHIIESLASFQKAIFLDPEAPMLYWAEALAYGPNINDVGYNASPRALAAVTKAIELSDKAGPKEKGLITAMAQRYSADSTISRETLNQRYMDAMKRLYQQYPEDAEIATLYADAIMLVHPWDLYDADAQPKPWTPELVSVLENAMKHAPNHPGANHFYIHAVEASLKPGRALSSAEALPRLMPKVSHVVHMPSHIYIRTGRYTTGSALNETANNAYREYLQLMPSVVNNAFLYLLHNVHMQAACAIMNGGKQYATESAVLCRNEIPADYLTLEAPMGEFIQYMYMTPLFAQLRYGQWNEILAAPPVADHLAYAKILEHFGRGFAYARLKKTSEAKGELEKLKTRLYGEEKLKIKMGAFNSAFDGGRVAEDMLAGIIAEEEGNLTEAEAYLTKAALSEKMLIYNEPRDWLLPVNQYLGAVLLKQQKNAEAEKVFRQDLVTNPINGWASIGVEKALAGKKGSGKDQLLDAKGRKSKDFNPIWPVY